jgi:hypothetical protein
VIIGLTLIVLLVMAIIEIPVAAAETNPAVPETPEATKPEGSGIMP